MKRRNYLATIGVGTSILTAGCSINGALLESGGSEPTGSREQIRQNAFTSGEEGKYQNRVVTIHELVEAEKLFIPADQFAEGDASDDVEASQDEADAKEARREPPTAGGLWVAIRISVEHVGNRRRLFPKPEPMKLLYGEKGVANQMYPEEPFGIRGDVYRGYQYQLRERKIHDVGAFPGVTLEGWVVFEVPEQYDLETLIMQVQWGTDNAIARWVFDESDRTPVQ